MCVSVFSIILVAKMLRNGITGLGSVKGLVWVA